MKESTKKRLSALVVVLVCLPFSIVGAASQSIIMGVFFGSVLAFGIDSLLRSYIIDRKEQ